MQHPCSQYKLYALPIYSQKAQLMLVFHLKSFPIRYLNALGSLWASPSCSWIPWNKLK